MNVLDSTWLGTESCLDSFPFFNRELANASSVRLLPTQQLLLASVPLRCLPVIWCLLDTFCPWTGFLVWSWFMSGEHSAKQLRLTPFSLSSQLFQPRSSAHPFFFFYAASACGRSWPLSLCLMWFMSPVTPSSEHRLFRKHSWSLDMGLESKPPEITCRTLDWAYNKQHLVVLDVTRQSNQSLSFCPLTKTSVDSWQECHTFRQAQKMTILEGI